MNSSFYSRFRWGIFLLTAVVAWLAFYGSREAMKTNSNRVQDWLPTKFSETQDLMWFVEHFGGNDLLMVSWEGCTVDDPRVAQLAERLRQPVELDGTPNVLPFREVVGVEDMLERFKAHAPSPEEFDEAEVLEKMEGWLVGPERGGPRDRTACLIIALTLDGWEHRHAAADFIRESADEVEGLSSDMLHMAGPTMDSIAIDRTSESAMQEMLRYSVGICIGIMLLCFRSIWLTILLIVVAGINEQLALSLVYFTGSTMDSIMLMVPSLVYVLSVSAGVHLINYYRDTVHHDGIHGAPMEMVRLGWSPCVLASATTALGLLSLLISFLVPIQKFGGYGALGLIASTVTMFLILPAALEQFPIKRWQFWEEQPARIRRSERICGAAERRIHRYHGGIVIASLLVLVVSFWGVTRLQATARVHDMFRDDSRLLRDYDWLENHIGPLVPVEVVLRVPKTPPPGNADQFRGYPMLDRFRMFADVGEAVAHVPGIGKVFSPAEFAPADALRANSTPRKSFVNTSLDSHREDFIQAGILREVWNEELHREEELWRVSARVKAGDRVDYTRMFDQLKASVEPRLAAAGNSDLAGTTAVYCGGIPLVQKAQAQLLEDLRNSFLVAFGFIAVAMMALLRSVRAGLLCMIPNILPAAAVFGVMGLLGIKVEVGSMMTATAAMGIAVDDTLHYVTWFRRGLAEGLTRREAIRMAYLRCGAAMIQTTLICGLGLAVFGFSPFGPISRFGILMFAMLFAALVGDLVVLPALLAGRLGRIFERRDFGSGLRQPAATKSTA